ncbi:MAG: CCA tRNA nucleotidyltransferase [Hyphomonadaceae bacterium]|nr:CCA tRNA nucleotidyltransferase [Hyphomonadaceae bacterium]
MSNLTHMTLNPATHPWMTTAAVQKIFSALPENTARFVGGCVRNALLTVPVADVDIATRLEPPDVMDALETAGIRFMETGVEYGTLTAVIQGHPYEITSLRRDIETDGRSTVVAFTADWREDSYRRDFTMNALYADREGRIYDPCGQGVEDLKARRFRFVGDADSRVREDYLRILRYFRLMAWYSGKGKIDATALRACRENRAGLKVLSAERVWAELKKLLSAPDPLRAVRIMDTNDILEILLPEAGSIEGLAMMVGLEKREGLSVDPLLRLMAMGVRDELAIAGLVQRLKVSKVEKSRLMGWASDTTVLSPDMDEKARKTAVYRGTAPVIHDRALICAAGADSAMISKRWMELAEFAKVWNVPRFPLKGRDLKGAGFPDGSGMGRTLRALEALWVRSGFDADKKKLLTALQLMKGSDRQQN